MGEGRAKEFIRARVREEERGYATPCWVWQRAVTADGYATGYLPGRGKHNRIHRAAYELLVGPISDGLVVDHLCRTRACCNPEHLEPVTHLENVKRGLVAREFQIGSYCRRGHEFSPENTITWKDGKRRCRKCNKEWRALNDDHATRHREAYARMMAAARIDRAGEAAPSGQRPNANWHGLALHVEGGL